LKKVSDLDLHNGLIGGGFICFCLNSPRTLGNWVFQFDGVRIVGEFNPPFRDFGFNRRQKKCLWKHQRRFRNRKNRKKSSPFASTVQDRSVVTGCGWEGNGVMKNQRWKGFTKFGKLKFDKMRWLYGLKTQGSKINY